MSNRRGFLGALVGMVVVPALASIKPKPQSVPDQYVLHDDYTRYEVASPSMSALEDILNRAHVHGCKIDYIQLSPAFLAKLQSPPVKTHGKRVDAQTVVYSSEKIQIRIWERQDPNTVMVYWKK